MRQSKVFLATLRDAPSDAEVVSHRLLAQAGLIEKLAAGVYSYTPAMWRVLKKISDIVREEMDRAGAQEVMLPILQPSEIWKSSGRWDRYVADGIMFALEDRKGSTLCLGPTHEEAVTSLVNKFIASYKQLPVNLYQIQTKFRDEIRPRFGLMRGREFIMKDAYSFDADEAGLDKSYAAMREAYIRICERIGLEYRSVQADPGAIGGTGSEEFMVLAETGEDVILYSDATGYAANQERAESRIVEYPQDAQPQPMGEVFGEGIIGVEALVEHLGIPAWKTTKTLLYQADEHVVAVMVRGDCDVNQVKVQNHLGCTALHLATPEVVKEVTGAEVGYAGPVGLPPEVEVLADYYLEAMVNFECGANKTNYHNINVNWGRDVAVPVFGDFKLAKAGDIDPMDDSGRLREARGIEIGHIFKLGTKYSAAMGAEFMAEDGKPKPYVMGCYGIGISRIAAAAVEQRHDEQGIIWPVSISPWHLHLICLNPKRSEQSMLADKLYLELVDAGVEVLYDDRPVSAGIKFNDADLIGLPLRVTVGRAAEEGRVEFVLRESSDNKQSVAASEILGLIAQTIK